MKTVNLIFLCADASRKMADARNRRKEAMEKIDERGSNFTCKELSRALGNDFNRKGKTRRTDAANSAEVVKTEKQKS
jgi:hypothetical protein